MNNYRIFGASDMVTVSREAWNDLQAYVQRLEHENDDLKAHVDEAETRIEELEATLYVVTNYQ